MSGSRRIFNYTADDATRFLLEADEDNYEQVNAGGNIEPTPAELTAGNYLPNSIEPRYAVYKSASGAVVKVPVVSIARVTTLPTTMVFDIEGVATDGRLSFYRGESGSSNFV